jgi:hypothetical protein
VGGNLAVKRFNIVRPREDGGVEVYPMKEWLRQHPQHVPEGLDATSSTSHQLRNGLRRAGWSVQETGDEVRLIYPGEGAEGTVGAVLGEDSNEEDVVEVGFDLEFQLRDFIAQNLGTIRLDGLRLRLYVDPANRRGVEYPTAVGPIDILAVDEADAFVVFELKRARSPDRAIGQLTRYMGWIRQTFGRDRLVKGAIVAKQISDNLRYAVSVVPNISLFEYEVDFRLRAAHDLR